MLMHIIQGRVVEYILLQGHGSLVHVHVIVTWCAVHLCFSGPTGRVCVHHDFVTYTFWPAGLRRDGSSLLDSPLLQKAPFKFCCLS